MAGQGKTTKDYAAALVVDGWTVLFICVPNTVHLNVVPIPTSHGVGKQRYPDIAAVKGNVVLLVEVEMSLTSAVAIDITLRFQEMLTSLLNPEIYAEWATMVSRNLQEILPSTPIFEFRLVLVRNLSLSHQPYLEKLSSYNIGVFPAIDIAK